jgi:ketosteroid isomerase-like protein
LLPYDALCVLANEQEQHPMADDATGPATVKLTSDATWTVEHFRTFWSAPDPAAAAPQLSPEIVGRWPDGRVLHGIQEYRGRLINLGRLIPDIRLEVIEYAVNGDLAFIRWRGHDTGRNGRFELSGVDRLRVDGDRIVENIVHFDTAAFERLVGVPLSST